MHFLESLAARRRFGMKPGLETITEIAARLGNPQLRIGRTIHIAGTNGKGATAAILDSALRSAGYSVARYTSPHLMRINERFFVAGHPISDSVLEEAARKVEATGINCTFFEALTAVAFIVFAETSPDFTILETGLGGRLDATNICVPDLCAITRIGLDHCDWLGDTVEKIAAEKAGIIKPGAHMVLGANSDQVRTLVARRADALDAPFHYAPDETDNNEIPANFSLAGTFNRENALTALAALKILGVTNHTAGFANVVWPGRFQRVGRFIVDGAHNPPAAAALAASLDDAGIAKRSIDLVCGFCGDKNIPDTLRLLAPFAKRAFAVSSANPRAMPPPLLATHLEDAGIPAHPCASLANAMARSAGTTLICGSLFLAGEALVELDAYPWPSSRRDPSEILKSQPRLDGRGPDVLT